MSKGLGAAEELRSYRGYLLTVRRLMGHENVNTTAIYAQATEEELARAVEGLVGEDG